MVVITQLPEGLKKLAFKKNDPTLIGGLSLVRFVNYPPKKPAGEKLSFVKITFSESVTKNCESFYYWQHGGCNQVSDGSWDHFNRPEA